MRMLSGSGSDSTTAAAAFDGFMAPQLLTPAAPSSPRPSSSSVPPPAGTSSNGSGFHADMVIVLAAVLCVLTCALGLQALISCARHFAGRRRRRRALAAVAAPSSADSAELSKKQSALVLIGRIPEAVYEAAEAGAGAAECAICLGEFADGDSVRLLPTCRHGFHVRCIDLWLSAHSSCPICRHSLLEEGAAAGEAAPVAGAGGT
ncbi:hypothetical protein U9M48_005546 [Paspalum notatum var. saurae]|uniref:RING-type domain-containing protein n=1 Tax=Paspalum notatum var. saurae TaxID=547442 RepID=A0AAQ3PQD5_PASNO